MIKAVNETFDFEGAKVVFISTEITEKKDAFNLIIDMQQKEFNII